MELTIKDVVASVGMPTLKNIRTRLGIAKGLSRKDELVEVLASNVVKDPGCLIKELTPLEKKLVAEVAHCKGSYDPEVFRAKYQGWNRSKPTTATPDNASPAWLFIMYSEHQGGYVMAPALASRVRGMLAKPAYAEVAVTDEVPSEIQDEEFGSRAVQVHHGAETALTELRRVLALAHAGKLKVSAKSRRPTRGCEKVISAVLIPSDFDLEVPSEVADEYDTQQRAGGIRSHAWAVLLQQCGWCAPQSEKLTPTEAGRRILSQGSVEEFRHGLKRFIQDDGFDELNRINHIKGQTGRAKKYMTKPSVRRKAIRDSMLGWPVDRWVHINEALRFIRASGRKLETCRDSIYLYFGSWEYGNIQDDDALDRQYLRAFLFESLGTLGVVDLAYVFPHYLWPDFRHEWGTDEDAFTGRYDGLLYVKLNRLGAYCLGLTDKYEAAPVTVEKLFRVLPNHEIVLCGHETLPPSVSHMLESMAVQTSDLVWKIDRHAIIEYLGSGGPLSDLQTFLTAYAMDGVPHQITVFLADLATKAEACRSSEEALLIEMANEQSAAEIAGDARTSKLCQLVGAHSLVVRLRNMRAF